MSKTSSKASSGSKKSPGLYRAIHHMNKGGLHRALGVPESETIPPERMAAARHSRNPHVRKMASFAKTLSSLDHSSKKTPKKAAKCS